mgnify:CR=1 FL=1
MFYLKNFIYLFLILSSLILSQDKTIISEYSYDATDNDSKISARNSCFEQLNKILLDDVRVFIKRTSSWKETIEMSWMDDDIKNEVNIMFDNNFTLIAIGTTEIVIIEETWNGYKYWIKAKIIFDPEDINKRFKSMIIGKLKNQKNTITNSNTAPLNSTKTNKVTLIPNKPFTQIRYGFTDGGILSDEETDDFGLSSSLFIGWDIGMDNPWGFGAEIQIGHIIEKSTTLRKDKFAFNSMYAVRTFEVNDKADIFIRFGFSFLRGSYDFFNVDSHFIEHQNCSFGDDYCKADENWGKMYAIGFRRYFGKRVYPKAPSVYKYSFELDYSRYKTFADYSPVVSFNVFHIAFAHNF